MKGLVALLLLLSASAAYGEVYTWKDSKGTVFYTNSIDEIPARYLKKARVYDVATGKKGGLATAQPAAAPATPAGAPQSAPATAPASAPAPVAAPMPTPTPAPQPPVTATPATPAPAPEATSPRLVPRESRSQRRVQRRRDYSVPEEE